MNPGFLEERDNRIRTGPKYKTNAKFNSFRYLKYQSFT